MNYTASTTYSPYPNSQFQPLNTIPPILPEVEKREEYIIAKEILQNRINEIFYHLIENENKKITIKQKKLSKIENIVKKIALENGSVGFLSINDEDNIAEKFFIAKIPKDTSVEKRRSMYDKIISESISTFEKNGLIDLFMETSIFLR